MQQLLAHRLLIVGRQIIPGRWIITTIRAALLIVGSTTGLISQADNQAQPALPTVELHIKDQVLTTELAVSNEQRYMGLSFRENLAENAAMLFVYQQERPLAFVMRNTLIPLSIAYISKDMVINEIHTMDVGVRHQFPSKKPAQYALEVNQGWFERNGIKAGARIVMR